MCYFMSVAVRNEWAETLKAQSRLEMEVHRSRVRTLEERLGDRFTVFDITTSSGCSCGLWAVEGYDPPEESPDELREKYRKRGWSASKIERAVTAAAPAAKRRRELLKIEPGLPAALREMLARVAEQAGELYILVHWINEDMRKDLFPIRAGPTLTPDELRLGKVMLQLDELMRVLSRTSPCACT